VLELLRGGQARSEARLILKRPEGLFQPYGTTFEDRYPPIFRFLRNHLSDGPERRLLSFGCSTGQEVFSLRRYFPAAFIRGIDINPRSIAHCQTQLSAEDRDRTDFIIADSAANEEAEYYDAVLAMSVFRHGDLGTQPPRCDRLLLKQYRRNRRASDCRRCRRRRRSAGSSARIRWVGLADEAAPTQVPASFSALPY